MPTSSHDPRYAANPPLHASGRVPWSGGLGLSGPYVAKGVVPDLKIPSLAWSNDERIVWATMKSGVWIQAGIIHWLEEDRDRIGWVYVFHREQDALETIEVGRLHERCWRAHNNDTREREDVVDEAEPSGGVYYGDAHLEVLSPIACACRSTRAITALLK